MKKFFKTLSKILVYIAYILCALFLSGWGLATGLSNAEKIRIIEDMATPIPERRVFFRWLKPERREQFIRDRVFTQERHTSIMNNPKPHTSGPGVFVSENLRSSSRYGSAVMQVEVAPNTLGYIDLTDEQTLKSLNEKGITRKEVQSLNPNVVIKNDSRNAWWQIKGREGVTFQAVNKEGVMSQVSPQTAGFVLSNQDKIGVELSTKDQRQIIDQALSLIKTSGDGASLLGSASAYLSKSDARKIKERSIPLIKSSSEGTGFLKKAHKALSVEDQIQVVEQTLPYINTPHEREFFVRQTHSYFSPSASRIRALTTIAVNSDSAEVADKLINKWSDFLPDTDDIKELKKTVPKIICVRKKLSQFDNKFQ